LQRRKPTEWCGVHHTTIADRIAFVLMAASK
jgi:hypothetical protein